MQVSKLMTNDPACCTPEMGVRDVAGMMVEYDTGVIPVVENFGSMKLVGMVTDRDITVRAVAAGRNPLELSAREVMSDQLVTVSPEADVQDAIRLMEEVKVRRLLVTNANGACCGVISQADVVRNVDDQDAGRAVREVSCPGTAPNQVDQDVRQR